MLRLVTIDDADITLPAALAEQYELVRILGGGTSGRVYLATDRTTTDDVVIKVMHQQVTDDPRVREVLQNELPRLQKVIHPCLVRTLNYGETEGLIFIVSEYVPGQSLSYLLSKGEGSEYSLPLVVESIGAALETLHASGLVHANLKPSNIMCLPDGQVKLIDPGAWRSQLRDESLRRGPLLTSPYAAPEQRDECGELSPASDIYALGRIIFKLVTGRTPSPLSAVDPRKANLAVPRWLSRLVVQMTQRAPAERVQAIDEVLNVFDSPPGEERSPYRWLGWRRVRSSLVMPRLPLSPVQWLRACDRVAVGVWEQMWTTVALLLILTTSLATVGMVSMKGVFSSLAELLKQF
jgi:serine/threonine protein kinase